MKSRAAILAVLVAGCGGDSPTEPAPAPNPTPTIPNIVGTYSGTWTNRANVPSTGESLQVVCPGGAAISSQGANGTFTGTWTQGSSPDCTADSGTLGGTVQVGGAVGVTQFASSNPNPSSIEDLTDGQCTLTQGIGAFTGTANGSLFEVAGTAIAQCLGIQVNLTFTLSTTKGVARVGIPENRNDGRNFGLRFGPTLQKEISR